MVGSGSSRHDLTLHTPLSQVSRLKAANPELLHRQAFGQAARNAHQHLLQQGAAQARAAAEAIAAMGTVGDTGGGGQQAAACTAEGTVPGGGAVRSGAQRRGARRTATGPYHS